MGMTVVEKILARASGVTRSARGTWSSRASTSPCRTRTRPWSSTSSTRSTRAPASSRSLGPVEDRDHLRPPGAGRVAEDRDQPEEGARVRGAAGITKFHDIRGDEGGICHQILPENGYVRPGAVVVGTDSHTTSHGALGAFAFGIGATEMASVWSLGVALNIEVPPTIKVEVSGRFPSTSGRRT
jgi:3-isopropylmalate/(R)-2-methylmalate dehydratase large subunit